MGRKEKRYHYIYKTTNVLSGKYYIGMHSTDDLNDGYMGSGNRLRLAIRKHGKENFLREILEFVDSREELKKREEEIVNINEIAKVECMNLRVGGEGGGTKESARVANEFMFSDENREKYSKLRSEQAKKMWDDPIIRKKMSSNLGWVGKKHSDDTKQKISESKKGTGKGYNNSQYGTCWITNGTENKKINKGDNIPEGWSLGRKIKK